MTSEERHWINVARVELGSLGKLRDVLDHWKRTGRDIQPISVPDAVEKFMEIKVRERLNAGTMQDISWRQKTFRDAFVSYSRIFFYDLSREPLQYLIGSHFAFHL